MSISQKNAWRSSATSIPTHYFSLTAAIPFLQPRIRNTIVTTWSSRISKSSSIDNTPSRSANIPRFVHSVAHIVMFHLTTSSHHHHHMTLHRTPQNLLDRTAQHLHVIHQIKGPLLHRRHLMTVLFPTRPTSFPAPTLHLWATKTLMTLTFNIWKYAKF